VRRRGQRAPVVRNGCPVLRRSPKLARGLRRRKRGVPGRQRRGLTRSVPSMGRGARLVARSSPAWPGAGAHRRRPRPRRRARRARRRRRSCPSRRRRRACRPRAARAAARRSPCPRRSARRAAAPQTARRPAGVACARTAGVMPNMLARLCRAGQAVDQRAQRCEGEGAPSAAQPAPAARRGARRDRLAISLLSSCCRYSRVFRFSTSAGAGGCSRKSGANASWYSFPGSSSPSSWPARAARCRS